MSLDAAILGFLGERPRSGYDLKTRCFDVSARAVWTADQAQVYRTLERLQKARLVSSSRTRQAGKPDRRVYQITAAGRESLEAWLATPQPMPAPRDPFLVQLFFSAGSSDETLLSLIAEQRAAHQVRLEDLRSQLAELATAPPLSGRATALRAAALDGSVAQQRALIDWLDDTAEGIRQGALPADPAVSDTGEARVTPSA